MKIGQNDSSTPSLISLVNRPYRVKNLKKFPSALNTTPACALIAPYGDLYASQCEDITTTSEEKKKQKLKKRFEKHGKGLSMWKG